MRKHTKKTSDGSCPPPDVFLLAQLKTYFLAFFLAAGFLAAGFFLAVVFLAAGFFLAVVFLAAGFFLAVVFLAAGFFLAVVFLAAGFFLAVVFLAAGFFLAGAFFFAVANALTPFQVWSHQVAAPTVHTFQ